MSDTQDESDVRDIAITWERTKKEFERRWNNHKVIYIIHDAPAAPLPVNTTVIPFLAPDEATDIVRDILSTDKYRPIDMILHTFGGDASATEMVAEALVAHEYTTAYVPYYAMSAGTEIALATRKIVMGKHASLGPTDLQIGGFPARDYEELVKEKGLKGLEDRTALIALLAQRAAKKDPKKMCRLINRKHKSMAERFFWRVRFGREAHERGDGTRTPHKF